MSDGREAGPGEDASADELYEHAPCAYLSTLPDGTIVRANQTFFDWLTLARDEVLGAVRFQSLLTMGARIYYETHYAPLLQMQGFVNEIALDIRRADGRICPVVASARQVRDAAGTAVVNRIALFDSTDRRQYERELMLARRQSDQDAHDLAAADRRKNEFIALLGHELRNPLAPIRHAIEILGHGGLDPAVVDKTTAVMQRQVAQMTRLVDDLLDVSRVGQDKLSLRRVPVDLASVVRHAVEISEPLLKNAGLTFMLTLAPTPIYVNADAARLVQVIGNILNNASKFTPAGGSVALLVDLDNGEARIRVKDTGIGIEPMKLSRVFDLFMQVATHHGRPDGLGIGLSLARSLVERHEGRIAVHSEGSGRGTEVVIRLPVLAEALRSVSRSFEPAGQTQPTPRRVLVVDDNHDSAELMAMLLGLSGHETRVASDGLEAVAIAAAFRPHVILLDIGLPKMNGYEAARAIRALPGPQPVLVAVTGWGEEEDRRRSAAAGFDVHLLKPVDHDVLTKLLADLPDRAGDDR